MIPFFKDDGPNLPPGIHECTLEEIEQRFSSGEKRQKLFATLRQVSDVAKQCGFLEIVIWGSFPTTKEDPRDLDLFITTMPDVDRDALQADCSDLLDHQAARTRWGLDVLYSPNNAILYDVVLNGLAYDRYSNPRGLLRIKLS